jgi:hypothetical protein
VTAIAVVAGCATAGDRRRARHGAAVATGAAVYIAIELGLKDSLAPEECRWCEPGQLDAGARDAVRWDDTETADQLSDATGFYLAPIVSLGLLAAERRHDHDVRRFVDDALPVVETVVISALFHHATKFIAGRARPFAHFGDPGREPDVDDNMSFYSGHTQLAFAVVTSAGTVARLRGYDVEPWIWGIGLPLAAATGYLRMAADKHYLVDVTTGALLGSAAGLLLPRLLLDEGDGTERPAIVPTPGGVAVVGTF